MGSVTDLAPRSMALSSTQGASLSVKSGGAVAATLNRPVAKTKPAMARPTSTVTTTPAKNFMRALLPAILVRRRVGRGRARAERRAGRHGLRRILPEDRAIDEDGAAIGRDVARRGGAGVAEALGERQGRTDLRVLRAHALEQARPGRRQLEAVAIAPGEDLAAATQSARVLFLQAIGAPDVVDPALVRGGSAASRRFFAHVLVGERIVVGIADANRLVLAGDLGQAVVRLHRRNSGAERLGRDGRRRVAAARPLFDRGQARNTESAVELWSMAVWFHGTLLPCALSSPGVKAFSRPYCTEKPRFPADAPSRRIST